MKKFIVEAQDKHAALFLELMKELKFVKSVQPVTMSDDDWVKPGRMATDEELEKYSLQAEEGPFIAAEEAKAATYGRISQWKKKNRK